MLLKLLEPENMDGETFIKAVALVQLYRQSGGGPSAVSNRLFSSWVGQARSIEWLQKVEYAALGPSGTVAKLIVYVGGTGGTSGIGSPSQLLGANGWAMEWTT